MAFGFSDPAQADIRRRADAQRLEAERMRTAPTPELQPLVGPGGMFWPTFQAPDAFGGSPAPQRQPAPWEYGPADPGLPPPPRAAGAPPPLGSAPTFETSGSYSETPAGLPGPPPMEQMSGVLSGASSTAGPSAGLPPPPQPSGLRVKMGGGDWQEADSDGRLPMPPTERSSTAYDPVDRRVEQVSAPSGGGTWSMMTAPENIDLATRGSQLEDAEFANRMNQLEDPYGEQRATARFHGDEAIRVEEAKGRIAMGKQAEMARESEQILAMSDQNEQALAQKYGIDPRDTQGMSIQDEGKRMQFQQEREALKGEIEARMALLLSRYGMAPRNAAGYEAMRGF